MYNYNIPINGIRLNMISSVTIKPSTLIGKIQLQRVEEHTRFAQLVLRLTLCSPVLLTVPIS